MTAEEFEKGYCERSGITREYYKMWFVTMTCDCDYGGCEGFAKIRNRPEAIEDQRLFHRGELV